MPRRRAPALALLLALALVAYPVTMPLAMGGTLPAPTPMSMHGAQHPTSHQHQPGHQHHAANVCCAGVCGSCPVVAVAATVAPRIRASAPVVALPNDLRVPATESALRLLPYSIGPPPPASLA